MLNALIELFETPEEFAGDYEDDPAFIVIEETGYQAAFSQLAFTGQTERDIAPHIADTSKFLADRQGQIAHAHPGKVGSLLFTCLVQIGSRTRIDCLDHSFTGSSSQATHSSNVSV